MEMYFRTPDYTIKDFKLEIIILSAVLILSIFVFLYQKYDKDSFHPNARQIKRTCIIIVAFFIIIFTIPTINTVIYMNDKKNDMIETAIIKIDGIWNSHASYYLVNDGKKYYTNIDRYTEYQGELLYKSDFLEVNYVGKLCEVEYYKNSRYLIRIKAIE